MCMGGCMWTRTVTESAESQRESAEIIADAATALIGMGFSITTRTPAHLEARGPGWNSTKQPAMRAASRVDLDLEQGRVKMRAELGGLAWMQRFTVLLPLGLIVVCAALIPTGILQNRVGGVTRPSTYADLAVVGAFMIPMSIALRWYVTRLALRGVAGFVRSIAA